MDELRKANFTVFQRDLKVFKTGYSETSLLEAFANHDAVVCAVATSSTWEQKKNVDTAVEAKVKRFIRSEYGVDASLTQIREILSPARPKADTIEYFKTKEKGDLTWTGFGAWFDQVLQLGHGILNDGMELSGP